MKRSRTATLTAPARGLPLALSLALLAATPILASCTGTTGGELVTFDAFAAGPEDAQAGQPYTFENSLGYSILLTKARLHVGAVYLNKSRPTSVGSETSCFLNGIYVAEVTGGLTIDVLSPEPQPFPEAGFATTEHASTAEVWLSGGGDINADSDSTVVLQVEGTATKGGDELPFYGSLTIGKNRVIAPSSPAKPGANPICKQRIVTPIPVDLDITPGEDLVLRVDPRGLFANVDFSTMEKSQDDPPQYRFRDDSADQASASLYNGLRASVGAYSVTWEAVE